MKGLNDRYAIVPTGRIGTGGNKRECIMKMGDSRLASPDYALEILVAPIRPCRLFGDSQSAGQSGIIDIVIESLERHHLDPVPSQHRYFILEDVIFTAWRTRPVVIMCKKNFHDSLLIGWNMWSAAFPA
jgi:hypothetical protein